MKKSVILYVFLNFSFTLVFSQSVSFGDVSKEEMKEVENINDPTANASYLYKYRKTYFLYTGEVNLVTEVHEKIKIYNKDAFDYATVEVNLFKAGSSSERINKIKAYTYNEENGEIVKTKLDKKDIFKSEFNDNYNLVKFTMPNVKEGSVIEYSYKITSPFFYSIDEYVFQEDIPIKKLEASFSAPEVIDFKPNFKGYLSIFPKKERKNNASLGMAVNVEKYNLSNVPAIKEEAYVDNIDNYRAGVKYEIRSVDRGGYLKYYSQTWKDVAQEIGNSDDYEKDIDKTKPFREVIDNLVADMSDNMDKMKSIFSYVKDNMTWNGRYNKYFQKGIKKALEEKKGNSADINLTLVSMLRYADLDANPVVICTRDNGIPIFPTLDKLNSVVAYVKIADKKYFLDATEAFSDINLLPINDYNWRGLLINNREMVFNNMTFPSPKKAVKQTSLNYKISENGDVEGNYSSKKTNHYAYQFRNSYKNQDMDTYLTEKEEDYMGVEISDYKVENVDTHEGVVNEKFNFFLDEVIEVTNDKILVKPLFFLKIDENPFKSEERKYPINFGYPTKDVIISKAEVPEGYKLESEVDPLIMNLPEGKGAFRYFVQQVGKNLMVTSSIDINNATYSAQDYLYLKEFFNQIIQKQTEPLILVKQ